MKITKYTHACFAIEKNGRSIIVDPGSDTDDFTPDKSIAGVLITHEHADHFSPAHIDAILAANPNAVLVGPLNTFENYPNSHIITEQTELHIEEFAVSIFPGTHDAVHPEIPTVPMLRYLVDASVYYGGDTLEIPEGIHPDVVAVPVASNWFRLADVIEMVRTLKPRYAFPTHDRLLSDIGKRQADMHLTNLTREYGVSYERLSLTNTLVIS
jgi:L-ascorbate metabolism protein UlaG (beta-lactamase superfamily)